MLRLLFRAGWKPPRWWPLWGWRHWPLAATVHACFYPPTAPMVKATGVCGASCVTPTWAFPLIRARTTSSPFWALRLRNVLPKTAT